MLNIHNEIRTWLFTQQDWMQELAETLIEQGNLTEQHLSLACLRIKSVDGQKVTKKS
jgi:hypothetical protein